MYIFLNLYFAKQRIYGKVWGGVGVTVNNQVSFLELTSHLDIVVNNRINLLR